MKKTTSRCLCGRAVRVKSVGLCGACYQRKWYRKRLYLLSHPAEAERLRLAKEERRKRQPLRQAQAARRWRRENPDKVKAWDQRRYRSKKRRTYMRDQRLKRSYGISLEVYDRLYKKQKGLCSICHRPERQKRKGVLMKLSVDHCHKKKEVRGLLCADCNRALGLFEDNPSRLRKAARYLEEV